MIKSQVIAGLRNTSHQRRILTEISSLPTLNYLVERLLTLESPVRATSHFQPIEASPPLSLHSNGINHFGNIHHLTTGAVKVILKSARVMGTIYTAEAVSNGSRGRHATSVV